MRGKPIDELNAGIRQLKDELLADEMAQKRVEIAIVGFGPVQVLSDFQTPDVFNPPSLSAGGDTPIGAAMRPDSLSSTNESKLIGATAFRSIVHGFSSSPTVAPQITGKRRQIR